MTRAKMSEVPLSSSQISSEDPVPEARERLTEAEIEDCIRCLELLVARPKVLAEIPEERRRELLIAAGKLSRPLRHERERVTKAIRRYHRTQEQQEDLELRQQARIRDGRVIEAPPEGGAAKPSEFPRVQSSCDDHCQARELNHAQSCYICKRDYTELHHFYDSMCPECGEFNYGKRSQSANLEGRIALVTGARIKIGFHTAMLLLRAGARVVATSRFPHDAALRFAREPDYEQFRERLTIYGLDLRFCPSVELFAAHLLDRLPGLDFLINNAAQTVHRPNGYYTHLLEFENKRLNELPEQCRVVLSDNHALGRELRRGQSFEPELTNGSDVRMAIAETAGLGVALPTLFGADAVDNAEDAIHFPKGRRDADGQQLDLRHNNSWRLKAADVSTPELIEVHLVNAIAPFLLISRLKPLMLKTQDRDKHIVNVSAMEGVFARRTKTDKHPHTNMAKASLNMLTRTSAKDFVRDGIHMNSVDTGWVTDEDPHPHAVRKRRDYDFSPPLDALDGAARICDPIFTGIATGQHQYGQFFKDYRPSEW